MAKIRTIFKDTDFKLQIRDDDGAYKQVNPISKFDIVYQPDNNCHPADVYFNDPPDTTGYVSFDETMDMGQAALDKFGLTKWQFYISPLEIMYPYVGHTLLDGTKMIGVNEFIVDILPAYGYANNLLIAHVIKHELAHALQLEKLGYSDHDYYWRDFFCKITKAEPFPNIDPELFKDKIRRLFYILFKSRCNNACIETDGWSSTEINKIRRKQQKARDQFYALTEKERKILCHV